MSKDDFFGPTTRFSGLAFDIEGTGSFGPIYPPNLTTDQRDQIAVTTYLPGAIVFNTNTEELETYSAAGFWLPILTAESDIDVTTITAETGDFDVINSTTINNAGAINTNIITAAGIIEGSAVEAGALFAENSITTSNVGNITTPTLFITDVAFIENGVIQTALAGGTGNDNNSPIVGTPGTGSGTGAVCVITGSLTSGVIQITTGTSPSASAIISTFDFPVGLTAYFNGTFAVIVTAANTEAAGISTYTSSNTTPFFALGLATGSTLVASTLYRWNYHIIGTMLN
jgi:hypothetical protein